MNVFMNTMKAIELGAPFWDTTRDMGLSEIVADNAGNGDFSTRDGAQFVNMSSYSYLGLDCEPAIVQAAADAVLRIGSLNTSISRTRVQFQLLKDAEDALSDLFGVEALTTVSCAAAATATLPLIAAGVFTQGQRPLMVFDKRAHFCLNLTKPICADETEVATCGHNDLDYLEDQCKKHRQVAYVADGVYSTGGSAPVKALFELQDRYGLFLFFDEAHGTSSIGHRGRGVVLEERPVLNERTIIVTSLNKGFGASGGAIFLGPRQHRSIVSRFGGPFTWSQRINTAGLGAILASVELHKTDRLTEKQHRLRSNLDLFDSLIRCADAGDGLPIRLVPLDGEEQTLSVARHLLSSGFYTSPLFFPIVARGSAGLRVMMRANLEEVQIRQFAQLAQSHLA